MNVLKNARWFVVAGFVVMSMAFVPASWIQAAGLDVWSLPDLHAEIAENERRSVEMDDEARAIAQRIAVKDQLVKDLVAGKTNLAAVTTQFEVLNSSDPGIYINLRDYYQNDDVRVLSARTVIAFAETYLDCSEHTAKKPKVMKRLDREFDSLFPDLE